MAKNRNFGQRSNIFPTLFFDNFRLQCRWRYPEKGDHRLAHCPAFVNLIAAKEIQMEEQKKKKNFITGKFEDIGGTGANKKLSHTGNKEPIFFLIFPTKPIKSAKRKM
mgnify:CR=1 FL=1